MKSFSVSIQIKPLQQFIYTKLSVFSIFQKIKIFLAVFFFQAFTAYVCRDAAGSILIYDGSLCSNSNSSK